MRRIPYLSLLLVFLSCVSAAAQEVHYPAEVKDLYDKADREVSEYLQQGAAGEQRRLVSGVEPPALAIGPRIAVPDCPQKDHLVEMVRMAGFNTVEMPGKDSSYSALWTESAGWDGAVFPEGWVTTGNRYSLLVYKAVADRNIPFMGTSPMTESIDRGLERMPCTVSTVRELARKAMIFSMAKDLMDGLFSIDTHCDLPENYYKGVSVGKRSESQCSIPKMEEGHLASQVLISFLWQGPLDDASANRAAEKNFRQIALIKDDIARYPELCGLASTPEEASALMEEGKKAFFIGVENGYGIGKDLGNIKKLRDQGVIYITLCHFRDNLICNTSSRHGSNPAKGLTEFGKQVVEEMNRQGMMIDLSHPSSGTFWDCIKYSKAPVICSHSGARAVYGHDRGLDDRQLKALAENGGVIQVYTVAEFIGWPDYRMTIDDMMKHFNHCVEVAGAEHVGIGSDFDGGGGVIGCNGDNDMVNITVRMLEHGYTPDQIRGFWGGNFMRVMKEVQAIAGQD